MPKLDDQHLVSLLHHSHVNDEYERFLAGEAPTDLDAAPPAVAAVRGPIPMPWLGWRIAWMFGAAAALILISVSLSLYLFGRLRPPTIVTTDGGTQLSTPPPPAATAAWTAYSAPGKPAAFALPAGWRRAALVVGVGRYRHNVLPSSGSARVEELSAARPEADRMAAAAVTYMGVRDDAILRLLDEHATEAAVRAALVYLSQFGAADDLVILNFACHARPDRRGGIRFILHDSAEDGGLWSGDIFKLLGPASAARVLLVANVCYAGKLGETLTEAIGSGDARARCWVVASSAPGQVSYEVKGGNESVFGRAWLAALTDGRADAEKKDDAITLAEAFRFASREMANTSVSQQPMLVAPAGTDSGGGDLIVAAHPNQWRLQPQAGKPAHARAAAQIVLGPAGDRPLDLWLDGVSLGTATGRTLLLPVAAGRHELRVRADPRWSSGTTPAETRVEFVADPAVPVDVPVTLAPAASGPIRPIGPEPDALFPRLIVSPPRGVEATWDRQVLKLTLTPGGDAGGGGGGGRVAAAQYIADPTRGVDVAAILGAADGREVELTLDARGSVATPSVVTFFAGGVGLDSLQPRQSRTVTLTNENWVRVTLTLPASRLHGLVNVLGVEASARDHPAGAVEVQVRDVTLSLRP